MKNILWFSELSKDNIPEVGGKGANLGEMTQAKFPIPPGFVVTAGAYYKFINSTGVREFIAEQTRGLNIEDTRRLNEVAEAIKDKILNSPMPKDVHADVVESYNRLCGVIFPSNEAQKKFVAIRSSATAEDLPEASFAGQQETYLNVRGGEEVAHAVQKCWASLFGARAIYYRQEQGFDHLKVGLAAVVQEMVQSERSGVMFSVNPVTKNYDHIDIEAAYGLGEVVVSGSVTPDTYIVDKNTMEIVSKTISKQTWMTTKVNNENKNIDIKPDLQEKQKLTDQEIIELAKVGYRIEKHYGKPQDMEFAFARGKLYIVQSRPITTLKMASFQKSTEKSESAGAEPEKGKPSSQAKILVKGVSASPGVASGKVRFIPTPKDIEKMGTGEILVTTMTTPDFVPAMKKACAIVTDEGGATAHAAIVSRELGIPCIVGTRDATKKLKEGMTITVDASRGVVYEGIIDLGQSAKKEQAPVSLGSSISEYEITGTKIYVNLAEVEQAQRVSRLPVDGVGLLRAEFMVAAIGEHPRKMIEEGRQQEYVDKLAEGLREFASAFFPRPIIYRATDFKSNEYRNLKGGEKYEPQESNPMMGFRGCGRYITHSDSFKLELMAIKKVREDFGLKNLHLMIPFVRRIGELRGVKDILREVGIYRTRDFKLFIMVEVPSTVILIDKFCEEGIDGVSIGSNDLTQLTLGIDRDNAGLAVGFDERNEAILRCIKHVIKTCNAHGVTTSICGQAPSVYPEFAEKLVEFGINSISVNPDVILQTRRIVASAEKKVMLKRLAKLAGEDKEADWGTEPRMPGIEV
ncbi:putative phosphoenolpyruvate synthase [Candidatus Gugararchaeum adminiculabundum]|nr:putative phosphoenolpyruvate synthase [Candidatus Gugararchaeum adminiculabundum]